MQVLWLVKPVVPFSQPAWHVYHSSDTGCSDGNIIQKILLHMVLKVRANVVFVGSHGLC